MRKRRRINQKLQTYICTDLVDIEGEFKVKITDDMIQLTGDPKFVKIDFREPDDAK